MRSLACESRPVTSTCQAPFRTRGSSGNGTSAGGGYRGQPVSSRATAATARIDAGPRSGAPVAANGSLGATVRPERWVVGPRAGTDGRADGANVLHGSRAWLASRRTRAGMPGVTHRRPRIGRWGTNARRAVWVARFSSVPSRRCCGWGSSTSRRRVARRTGIAPVFAPRTRQAGRGRVRVRLDG